MKKIKSQKLKRRMINSTTAGKKAKRKELKKLT